MLRNSTISRDAILSLEEWLVIPFKMYAWLDLMDKKERHEHVNTRDLRKHRLDVFRLLEIVSGRTEVECSLPFVV